MKESTVHQMNSILDIANEVIEEDKDLVAKIKHVPTVTYTGNGEDLMEDYMYSRDTLKDLISSGTFAIAKMETLLTDSDKPRNFEVFATLMKSISDLTTDLIKLQKQMKEITLPVNNPDGAGGKEDDDSIKLTTDQLNNLLNNR